MNLFLLKNRFMDELSTEVIGLINRSS